MALSWEEKQKMMSSWGYASPTYSYPATTQPTASPYPTTQPTMTTPTAEPYQGPELPSAPTGLEPLWSDPNAAADAWADYSWVEQPGNTGAGSPVDNTMLALDGLGLSEDPVATLIGSGSKIASQPLSYSASPELNTETDPYDDFSWVEQPGNKGAGSQVVSDAEAASTTGEITEEDRYRVANSWLRDILSNHDGAAAVLASSSTSFRQKREYLGRLGFDLTKLAETTGKSLDYVWSIILDPYLSDTERAYWTDIRAKQDAYTAAKAAQTPDTRTPEQIEADNAAASTAERQQSLEQYRGYNLEQWTDQLGPELVLALTMGAVSWDDFIAQSGGNLDPEVMDIFHNFLISYWGPNGQPSDPRQQNSNDPNTGSGPVTGSGTGGDPNAGGTGTGTANPADPPPAPDLPPDNGVVTDSDGTGTVTTPRAGLSTQQISDIWSQVLSQSDMALAEQLRSLGGQQSLLGRRAAETGATMGGSAMGGLAQAGQAQAGLEFAQMGQEARAVAAEKKIGLVVGGIDRMIDAASKQGNADIAAWMQAQGAGLQRFLQNDAQAYGQWAQVNQQQHELVMQQRDVAGRKMLQDAYFAGQMEFAEFQKQWQALENERDRQLRVRLQEMVNQGQMDMAEMQMTLDMAQVEADGAIYDAMANAQSEEDGGDGGLLSQIVGLTNPALGGAIGQAWNSVF